MRRQAVKRSAQCLVGKEAVSAEHPAVGPLNFVQWQKTTFPIPFCVLSKEEHVCILKSAYKAVAGE